MGFLSRCITFWRLAGRLFRVAFIISFTKAIFPWFFTYGIHSCFTFYRYYSVVDFGFCTNQLLDWIYVSIIHREQCFQSFSVFGFQVCGGASHLSVWHLRSKTSTAILSTSSSCPQVVKFEDDFILSAGTEPTVFKWSINGELRGRFPCTPKSIFSMEVNKTLNRVLAISGTSHQIDISTNFDYKAFSLQFRQSWHPFLVYCFQIIFELIFVTFVFLSCMMIMISERGSVFIYFLVLLVVVTSIPGKYDRSKFWLHSFFW